MSTISRGLPDSPHRRARDLAQEDGIPINPFVASAVAGKIRVLDTADYPGERAKRGSQTKFLAALARA
jgi:hypothetical protein